MDPKEHISSSPTEPAAWALTPLEAPERAHDSASERTLEMLRLRDPDDARYETTDDPRIPNERMFFKIGEVADITGIKPYVLRYWEIEFPWIKPEKTSSRQRRYRRQDIALLFKISRLRYEDQRSIEETRQAIKEARTRDNRPAGRTKGSRRISEPKQLPLTKLETAMDRAEVAAREIADEGVRSSRLSRALADMRKTVLELLEAVEE
jgi:DNA-binding transcriptional MerR regulator